MSYTAYISPLVSQMELLNSFGNPPQDRFVQIGNFRVGDVDGQHFSVAHVGGKTMQIFRSDGTLHPGPRSDYTTVGRPMLECKVAE